MAEEKSTFTWQTPINFGLLGGVVITYFSAIGMVESFAQRNLVGTFLSMAHILLFAGAIGAGYLTARAAPKNKRVLGIASALLAGLVAAIFPVILVIIAANTNIREMFINVSDGMIEIMTFGRDLTTGSLLFVVTTILVSLAGAIYYVLPEVVRKPLTASLIWVFGIGVFSEHVGQILSNIFGRRSIRLVFKDMSLLPSAALVIAVVAGLISYLSNYRSGNLRNRMASLPPAQKKSLQIGYFFLIALGLVILPQIAGRFLSQVLFLTGLYIMMGLGLNIVVGYAGLLDLGYVAFFAFGAYTMAILTTTSTLSVGGFNFWIALPIAILVAVGFGLMLGLPVLGMRGDYLAITTLGFGEIIRLLALSDWLKPLIGGAQGVLHIPNPSFFGIKMDTPEKMYYVVLVGAILVGFISIRLRDSRLGRQWMAMREDEDVAEAMGIHLVQTKLLAFAIGAGFSGLSGAIFAARLSNIFPHTFNLLWSINALSLIIVGGMGSIPGVVIGALVLVGMPEILREFAEYRLLMYGILLIVMMLVKPEGFLPAEIYKREYQREDEPIQTAEAEA